MNSKAALSGAITLAMVATLGSAAYAQEGGQGGGQGGGRQGGGQGGGRQGGGGRGFGGGFGGFGGFGQRGGQGMQPTAGMLPLTVLSKSLGLTDEQKTKIEDIQKKAQENMRASFGGFGGGGGRPDPEEMRARFEKMNEDRKKTDADIMAILTDDQKKSLETLLKDAQVFMQAQLPLELAGDLKLTADQKKQISETVDKIQKAAREKTQEARENQDFETVREIMQQAQAALREKTRAVLTAEQKSMVEKWEKDNPRGRGFGGPGGGRGPGGEGGQGRGQGRGQRPGNGNPPPPAR